jgi:putative ABC transport system permease protein
MSVSIRALWNVLRDRVHREALAAELDDELQFHQAMLERDHGAAGASIDAARRLARLQLGNATHVREETRAMWTLGWVDDLASDLRYAARVLRRNAGFTVAAVATLALGIGANTAIFSVVNAVLFRPLPYANADRLVSVWTAPAGSPAERNPASLPDVEDWAAQNTVFAGVGAYAFNRYELTGREGVDQARAAIGTPTLYIVLGTRPLLGRMPLPEERQTPVVAISYRLWQRRYAGDRTVIGRTVTMDELPYTIVGVMPPGFHFPAPDIDLWTSLFPIAGGAGTPPGPWIDSRSLRAYRAVARLRPGVSRATAEAAMATIEHRLGQAYPQSDAGMLIKLQSLREDSVGGVQRGLWLMFGAAGLVLTLACVNVAHLMLARTSTRGREIAVRRALGAHRGRVARQLLTESVLLALIGGLAGVVVAIAGTRLLVQLSPPDVPRLETVHIDGTSLLFAVVASVLTGMIFGSVPAVAAWRSGVQSTLREQGRGSTGGAHASRMRSMLTTAEVAFALMLLVGAGLTIRSFALLLASDVGFRSNGVVTFHVGFSETRYPKPQDKVAALDRMLEDIRALPGVISAGGSTSMPPSRTQEETGFTIDGQPKPAPGHEPIAIYLPATPHFLASLGIPIVAGRDFTNADGAAAPQVTIVNRVIAQRFFTDHDPLNQRITLDGVSRTIVGVSGDAVYNGVGVPIKPEAYVPFAQSPFPGVWIAVSAAGAPSSLIASIRSVVHAVDPLINARELRPMDEMISDSIVRPRFQTWLLAIFGALALTLAAIGIYGVIAYSVAQRTSEIGLRIALGAPPSRVVGMVMRSGMIPVAAGLATGIAASLLLSKAMVGLLYGVRPTDAVTFVVVTVVLAGVAAAASYLPAMRAAAIDPISALRTD